MFVTKFSEREYQNLCKEFKKSKGATKFYEDLKAGVYHIYYRFDSMSESLGYEVFSLENDDYYFFTIDSTLYTSLRKESISSNNLRGYSDGYISAFFAFLYEKEKPLSPEELTKLYEPNSRALLSIMQFSAEENRIRKNQQYDLQDLLRRIQTIDNEEQAQKQKETKPATPIAFQYEFFVYAGSYENIVNVRIRQKRDSAKKFTYLCYPNDFLDDLETNEGGEIQTHSGNYSFDKKDIPEEDLAFFSFLSNSTSNYYAYQSNSQKEVAMPESQLAKALYLLKGRTIYFNDDFYSISKEEKEATVEVKDNGQFSFDPEPGNNVYYTNDIIACLDIKKHIISFYRVNDKKTQVLFTFANSHPDFRFDLFADKVSSEILPSIEDNHVTVSDAYKEKHPYYRQSIHYIVTYTEKGTLLFQTEYYFDKEKVSKQEFLPVGKGEEKENRFSHQLELLELPENGEIDDLEKIASFLKMDLTPLKSTAEIYLSENIAKTQVKGVGKISIFTSSGIDWLQMRIGSPSYTDEELETILTAYRKKKKYVKLKDSIISFDDDDSKSFKEMVSDFKLDQIDTPKLPIYDALKLSQYSDKDTEVTFSPELKTLFEDIKEFPKEKTDVPEDIEKVLRPYQKDGVKWLHVLARHNLSGILADDMGLGKTLEMIALLSTSKEQRPILIVTPKSLIYNWEKEFHHWDPKAEVNVLDGSKTSRNAIYSQFNPNKKEVYVTSYESLRNDLDEVSKFTFSYVILDEGQNIANVFAKKTRAAKQISATHKFVLTGTPIQNSYMDLWSIFDFLMPGYLPSYRDFYADYGKGDSDEEEDKEAKEELSAKIAPFILKRRKEDVLKDLPPKTESVITVGMSEKQRELYDASLQDARRSLTERIDKIAILAEITRLREICVDPKMAYEDFPEESEKLLAATETIKQAIADGHKVLVFSTFVQTLNALTKLLDKEKIPSAQILGSTPAKTRIALAEDFNTKDNIQAMLVSLKAGGTGLNLIGADIVIHLDPWWNLAAENQATDRTHRIGQTRPVTVLKMICKNSIEERIIELQNKKKELASVIQNGDEGIRSLDLSDLQFLLS